MTILKTVTIQLDPPLEGPKGLVREAVLREPDFTEILQHGEPYTLAKSAEGAMLFIENPDALLAYSRLCVVRPDPLLFKQGGVKLARQVKEVIFGFFLPEVAEGVGSQS